ncbi:hypothetical protein NKZ03_01710 [Sinorhizobium meliloti]|uniref:hypothetical protein n=1 Tax=Rhizobium meliloti TaxID=382 RepID=UPI003D6459DE
MLSFIKTSAIAALTLSLAAGGAFAANHHGHEDRGFSARGPENGSYYQGVYGDDGATITAAPVYQTTTGTAVSAPRLSKILSELRAANQRMESKRSVGELTTVALNKLRHEEADIRAQAVRVGDLHGGMIPNRSYAQLQKDIRRLDRNISRSA